MIHRIAIIAAAMAGIAPPTVAAQGPIVTIPRLEGAAVVIDGRLDESAWQSATRLDGFRQQEPVDGRPAEDSTVARVWYAPDAIYIGVMVYDREPERVRATLADRDNIGSDDQITVYLDTFNDRRRAYFFGVNPLGVQSDGVRSEGGFSSSRGSGSTDRNPDFIWESKGQLTPFGWSVEMRIPFKSLRWGSGSEHTWGFNIVRNTQRTGYTDTWTDVRRASASFLGQAGAITGIHGIRRGVVTEIQPAMVAEASGRRTELGFDGNDPRIDAGVNVRLGFTSLTVDATYNPDFSQVESDVGVVTVNERFAISYPERRPFFLEGIELFASPSNLVYTRSVANPLAGGKITGKFGSWTVAHLSAVDEYTHSSGHDAGTKGIANISRIRRDLGTNSVAGITVTNRDEDGAWNRVLSADTRVIFGRIYYMQAQLAGAFTRDSSNGETRSAPLWSVEVDRTGRAYGFNYAVNGTGDDFSTWSGFVNRSGIVNARSFNRLALYGATGSLIERSTFILNNSRLWSYEDRFASEALEGNNSLNASFDLRGGWRLDGTGSLGFTRFSPDDYRGLAVGTTDPAPFVPPAGVFDNPGFSLQVGTPTWRIWDASVQYNGGTVAIFPEAAEGKRSRINATINARPMQQIRLSGSLTWETLDRSRDGSEFARTVLPRMKLEFQPTRAFFMRVVAEHRSEQRAMLRDPVSGLPLLRGDNPVAAIDRKSLRFDWLASVVPRPGTVAFFGYGSTLEDRPISAGERQYQRQEDAFFVKLAYLFRI